MREAELPGGDLEKVSQALISGGGGGPGAPPAPC